MYLRSGALAVALLLAGCAGGPPKPGPESLDLGETPSRPGASSTASDPRDPFQGPNRAMWAVNYDVLKRSGLWQRFGQNRLFLDVHSAVEAYRST